MWANRKELHPFRTPKLTIQSKFYWFNLILIICLLVPLGSVFAQEESQPNGPVYIVQPGDTLSDIARRFGVPINELIKKNGISDPNNLQIGSRLAIPGLEGLEGILITRPVNLGETARSLSRQYQVPLEKLERLNHLTSPNELYVGSSLILPEPEDLKMGATRSTVSL